MRLNPQNSFSKLVLLNERTSTVLGSEKCRYGYNGMELDKEVKGDGNSYDFGARLLDPRLGRWLTIDPLFKKQPDQSPYKAFYNSCILFNDLDGEIEKITIITHDERTGTTTIKVMSAPRIMTDGKKRNVYFGQSCSHQENDYYDFRTVMVFNIDKKGQSKLMFQKSKIINNKWKDADIVWNKGAKNGDTKAELTLSTSLNLGGLTIYGSSSDSKDSPANNTKTSPPWGSFDFGEFSETLSLISTAIATKGENTLEPGASTEKLAELLDKSKEVVETFKSEKGEDQNFGIQKKSVTLSNTTVWRTESNGRYTGTNDFASPQEMRSGDTLNGKFPRKDSHPEKKANTSKPRF